MVILIKRKSDGEELTEINLPHFCLAHMKNTSPEDNLKMMLKHINSTLNPACSRIFIDGEERSGITADDVSGNLTLEVDF